MAEVDGPAVERRGGRHDARAGGGVLRIPWQRAAARCGVPGGLD
jgi:hypothetical protein